jgi:hypothetical protein
MTASKASPETKVTLTFDQPPDEGANGDMSLTFQKTSRLSTITVFPSRFRRCREARTMKRGISGDKFNKVVVGEFDSPGSED